MVLHFLIQGRVQGVGFRWFVHREASELDLRGWVRNTEDGDVEVVAHGEEADLAELRASLPASVEIWAGGGSPALRGLPIAGIRVMSRLLDIDDAVAEWRHVLTLAHDPNPDAPGLRREARTRLLALLGRQGAQLELAGDFEELFGFDTRFAVHFVS